MPLTFDTLRDQEERTRVAGSFTLTERVCLNADKSAVVSCDSQEATFSLGGQGTLIPMADAERYGLLTPKLETKIEVPTETKPKRATRQRKG